MPGVVVRSDDACKQQAPVTASSGVAVCFHPMRQTVTLLSHNAFCFLISTPRVYKYPTATDNPVTGKWTRRYGFDLDLLLLVDLAGEGDHIPWVTIEQTMGHPYQPPALFLLHQIVLLLMATNFFQALLQIYHRPHFPATPNTDLQSKRLRSAASRIFQSDNHETARISKASQHVCARVYPFCDRHSTVYGRARYPTTHSSRAQSIIRQQCVLARASWP